MKSSFFRMACLFAVLAGLGGCAQGPWADWFGQKSIAHPGEGAQTADVMPPPTASPVPPVETRDLLPVAKQAPTPTSPPAPAQQAQTPPQAPQLQVTTAQPQPQPAATDNGTKIKVAILLPLTGRNAALGQSLLNAAQQAVFDVAATNFELMPRDTGDGEKQAGAAARDAIGSGAQFLIGPLFAANIPAVRDAAKSAGVSMLTLSSDASLAAPGVYVMGFSPGAQVEQVTRFAAAHGMQRFAALIPNNAYGALVADAFRAAVNNAHGAVVAFETYDPARHDSEGHIRNLAVHKDQIDALFLPEGGADLALVTNQLLSAGFDPQRLHVLGTGLWDVPDIAQQSAFVTGGWYVAADPAVRAGFVSSFKSTYNQDPPRLATLAYDATALASVLAKRGGGFVTTALTNPNGFAGLDGIFRLEPNGTVERGMAVLEVTDKGPRVIDHAPTTFKAARE